MNVADLVVGMVVRWATDYYVNDGNLTEVLAVDKALGVGGAARMTYKKYEDEPAEAYWEFADKDGFIGTLRPL